MQIAFWDKSWGIFWQNVGGFLGDFWGIFGGFLALFLADFWGIFGPFFGGFLAGGGTGAIRDWPGGCLAGRSV